MDEAIALLLVIALTGTYLMAIAPNANSPVAVPGSTWIRTGTGIVI